MSVNSVEPILGTIAMLGDLKSPLVGSRLSSPPLHWITYNTLGIVYRDCTTYHCVVGNPKNYHNTRIPIICSFFLNKITIKVNTLKI